MKKQSPDILGMTRIELLSLETNYFRWYSTSARKRLELEGLEECTESILPSLNWNKIKRRYDASCQTIKNKKI